MSYNILAKYYQLFTNNDCDYNQWSQYLSLIINEHNARKGADIACGTGKMTRLLSKRGYNVVGIDNSIDMLNVARAEGKCNYVCQDMIDFSLPSRVGFVTCINDGVNYIKPSDLNELFVNVYNQLVGGGVFIFDISSSHKLVDIIGDNVFYHDYEDVTCLWTNKLHGDRVVMDISMFIKQDNELYVRQDEQHIQYIHDSQNIVNVLTEVGFSVKVVDNYTDKAISCDSQRITFIATRSK